MHNNKIVVHMRAPVLSLSGYGVHARQIADFFLNDDRFILCLENIRWGSCPFIHDHPNQKKYYDCIKSFEDAKAAKIEFDISVHVSIPNEFSRNAKLNIGVTAGIEVDRITKEWIHKCNEMDFIIVPSEFSKKVLEGTAYQWKNKKTGETGDLKIVKPIKVINEWFQKPEEIKPLDISFDTKINFLHVGQWGNKGGFGEDRKNIADLIRIFCTVFREKEDVGLVLKINIINNTKADLEEVKKRISQIKENFGNKLKCKIYLIHDSLSEDEMWGLYNHPDISAFVSFTHGEGYGLPLLEAAASGLPVIATNWSGHLDFLEKGKNFIPIDFDYIEIPECQIWEGIIDKGSRWARIKEDKAAKALRRLHSNPKKYKKSAEDHVEYMTEKFGRESLLKEWKSFFDQFLSDESTESNNIENRSPISRNPAKDQALQKLKSLLKDSDKRKVLYVMPRSAGDVLISTAIVDSLIRNRHFDDCDFYFATTDAYSKLLDGLKEKYDFFNVIPFCDEMMSTELVSEVWDYVYNPTVNVQYNFSNWLLGNGEYSVRLLEEFAKSCNLSPSEVTDYVIKTKKHEVPKQYITFSPTGTKDAKDYMFWEDVLHNLKNSLPDLEVVQTGLKTEKLYDGVNDARGLEYDETIYLIENAAFHIGVDSFPAHVAAAVSTPHVVIYGSTSALTVTPVFLKKKKLAQYLIDSPDRNGCKNPCYKDVCTNRRDGLNCLSNIPPEAVYNTVMALVDKLNKEQEENDKQVAGSEKEEASQPA